MMTLTYTHHTNPARKHYTQIKIPLAWEINLSEPDLIVPPGLINSPRWGNYPSPAGGGFSSCSKPSPAREGFASISRRPLQIMDFRGLCTSGAWSFGHSVTVCHVLSERLDDSGHSVPGVRCRGVVGGQSNKGMPESTGGPSDSMSVST